MPRTKNRSSQRPSNYQSFYIEVDGCEPAYSFAVNNFRHHEGPYREHLEITVSSGIFLAPERLKGRRMSAVFLGSREDQSAVEQATTCDWKPRNVGVLTVRGHQNQFLGSLPYDALWALVHAFDCGMFRIVDFYGILERGRANIQSIHFTRAVDPKDL
jgi:hypothetical protein